MRQPDDEMFGGIYRAICQNNADPQGLNRITMKIPALFGNDETDWAWSVGVGVLPGIGDGVWVMFEAGNPSFPVWLGPFDG